MRPTRGIAALAPIALTCWLLSSGCVEPTSLYCDGDQDCLANGLRAHCNVAQHVCLDDDALPGDDLLPPPDGAIDLPPTPDGSDMVAPDRCVQTSDCIDVQNPVCGASGACEPCDDALDDAVCLQRDVTAPRCRLTGLGMGRCVACREASANIESADCTGAVTPVCDADGSCRACAANDECASNVCDFGTGGQKGRCVPAGEIVYVDNRNLPIATCNTMFTTQNGSVADPYCDIDQAIDAVAARPVLWIVAAGHAAAYSPLSLTGVVHDAVIIRGPGSTAAEPVAIKGAATLVAINTAGLALELAGVVVDAVSSVQDGIVVTAAERVTLTDVLVQNCGAVGVQVSSGGGILVANKLTVKKTAGVGVLISAGAGAAQLADLEVRDSTNEGVRLLANGPVVDRVYLQSNKGGGVEVGAVSSARIQNAIIRGNGNSNPSDGAVSVFGGVHAKGTLQLINSSLEGNEADTADYAAGVRCADANGVLLNVVAIRNDGKVGNPDISPVCATFATAYPFSTTATNGNVTLTGCTSSQVFTRITDPIDFRPNMSAPDGCKLRNLGAASGGGATAASADYAGTARPQEGVFDIGAYESVP